MGPALSIRLEMPFSVRIFAAIPPEWPEPMINTSTFSTAKIPSLRCFVVDVRPASGVPLIGIGAADGRRGFAADVGIDREPIQTDVRRFLAGCGCGCTPGLGVDGCGADVAVRDVDEVRVWLGRGVGGDPGAEPGAKQLISLRGVHCLKRYAEVLPGLGIETVQTGAIHLLAIRGRAADEEIKELRCSGVGCSGISLKRRHEDLA